MAPTTLRSPALSVGAGPHDTLYSLAVVRLLLFLVFGGAFVAVLFFTTQRESTVECSVCIDYEGRSACRTVLAATRDDALAGAIRNACAVLSSGVTSSLACDRQLPRSVECSE